MPQSGKGGQVHGRFFEKSISLYRMGEKSKIGKVFSTAGYILSCLILLVLVAVAVGVLVQAIEKESAMWRIYRHVYFAAGFAAFFLLYLVPRVHGNIKWLMSFSHEFTHLLFAVLFFRKIHRFKVDDKESYVSYSGGWFGYHIITLAPYCIPVFTLALLPWRFTTSGDIKLYLHIIDVLLGFTYAFHILTWIRQIRLSQSDIIGPGILKSILFITFFQLLFLSLVLLTPVSGVVLALKRVFIEYPSVILAPFISGLF